MSPRWLLGGLLLLPPWGLAQTSDEPSWDLGEGADKEAAGDWETRLEIRGDHVEGLPAGRSDLNRLRARLELAYRSVGASGLGFGLAAQARVGSDANRDNLANLDNEKSDGLALMEAWLGWRSDRLDLSLGKAPTALALTPLLWDADLRPVGLNTTYSRPQGDFNRWEFVASVVEPDHPLGGDARLLGLQAAWHWREGAPTSASVRLGVLDFSGIDALARAGLGRGNSIASGRYLHGYRLLDLQAELGLEVAQRPLRASLDLVRNLDAPAARDGARLSLLLGDLDAPGGWQVGYAVQRFQRDAVLAAFSSDDWWFHTGARGHMPSIAYAIDRHWSLRLAGLRERRDGLPETTMRVLVDLNGRW